MRLSKRKRSTSVAMNITPMIDIVFLLIIFFITVTQISKVQKTPLELPEQKGSDEQRPSTLIVNITEDQQIVVSGKPYNVPGLVTIVSSEIAKRGGDTTLVRVLIRGDRKGKSATVNRVVSALTELNVKQIRIAVASG